MKLFIQLTILIFLFFFCQQQEENKNELQETKIPVKLEKIETKKISIPIIRGGRLFRKHEIKLSFKTPGIIEKFFVSPGEHVKKNTLLASIKLSEIKGLYEQAKSSYQMAERDFKRAEKLFQDKALSLEQFQNIKTSFEIAENELNIAEFNFKHSKIYAPFDGMIMKKFAEIEEMVNAGTPIIEFGSKNGNWIFQTSLSDIDIIHVEKGDSAEIRLACFPGKKFIGEINEINENPELYTGTYNIEIKLLNYNHKFKSGMTGESTIYPKKKENYTFVPIESLVTGKEKKGIIYVLDTHSSELRQIHFPIEAIIDGFLLIEEGIIQADSVITEGSSYITKESKVRRVNHETAKISN